ncbi:MAG: MFS transporter [Microbacterium sp.]
MGDTSAPTRASLTERLDVLPFTRKHLKLLTGTGIGWALDAMDVGVISFILAALTQQWGLTRAEAGWVASAGFIGMALGATIGGLLADRLGRRQVFAITLLVYGLATGASALVGGLALLLVLRFLVGLGLGAELPVASTYISELAPAHIRGRLIVILEAFWALGWTAAALIGYLVIPASADGWRWAFALGAIPAVYALVVRWGGMPESPRWLTLRGRVAEAEAVVASFEKSAGIEAGPAIRKEPPSRAITATTRARVTTLWHPEFRLRTACLWVVWLYVNFAYYGAFIWMPSILVDAGFDLVRSFGFTLIITLAQLPGYALAAWLIEVWGRRSTLSVFLVGSAASALVFGTATTPVMIVGAGMALSFFNLGAWGALYAITPEIYPTSLRGSGAGWAAGIGRLASIIAPLAVPVMLAAGGPLAVFIGFGACFIFAALAAWGLSDRKGQALDDR